MNTIHTLKILSILFYLYFLKILFIFREGEGKEKERKKDRKTSMCERNIDHLPLTCPQLGTWSKTQACAQLGIKPVSSWFAG